MAGRLLDFRLFVHDVELVRAGGEHVPFRLTEDGAWQRDGVALLDFEDGSGSCETGSADTNARLRGEAPQHEDYTGVAFTLGMPERRNHLDAATAQRRARAWSPSRGIRDTKAASGCRLCATWRRPRPTCTTGASRRSKKY